MKKQSTNQKNESSYALSMDFQDSGQLKDSIPLFILIVIGVVGVFYVLQHSSESINSSSTQAVSYFTSNTQIEGKNILSEEKEPQKIKTPIAAKVKVRGVLEAKERITFKIENYDPAFIYSIDFGNGSTRLFDNKRVSYIYPEAGTFVVRIMAENLAGVRQNVFKKLVSIDKAIRIYDNAHLERMN